MKIVIFGTGKVYRDNKLHISQQDDIVAFLDNNSSLQGKTVDGIKVYAPTRIHSLSYDKIILMSDYADEMRKQLLDILVDDEEIWNWRRYECECSRGVLKLFCYQERKGTPKKRILLLAQHLSYDGSAMAAVHAIIALQSMDKGYHVILAAPSGDPAFVREISGQGVNIVLCPAVQYLGKEEMYWINQFDIVIVNVFPMISCACEISKFKPVLWWLHEVSAYYESTRKEFSKYDNISAMKHINVVAVSEIARRNFEVYYPGRVNAILPYGIPDEYIPNVETNKSDKFVFAIIGGIEKRKAQKIFVQAVMNFAQEEMADLEFLIIGSSKAEDYFHEVEELAGQVPQIHIVGQLSRREMWEMYQKIDVVVCASVEECLPTTVTEGLMHGKVCIATETSGTGEYIIHGENGFICKTEDADSLYNIMAWVSAHRDELEDVRRNARKTYEKYFTMEIFGKSLEMLLEKTERREETIPE